MPRARARFTQEDQARYDERKEDLRATPAAVHFFSFEPLLGPINADYLGEWAIVGGESGAQARPMHPDWPRSIRDQCAAAGVPFFFKQWGEWIDTNNDGHIPFDQRGLGGFTHIWDDDTYSHRVGKKRAGRMLDGIEHNAMPEVET